MKRVFIFVFLAILSINCFSQVIIGKRIDQVQNLRLLDSSIHLLVESAQISEVKIAIIGAVFYQILLDTNNRIKFISTEDINFKSEEGVRVGDTWSVLKKRFKLNKKKVIKYAGWGSVLEFKSGWLGVFDFSKPIQAGSPILFFYQKSK
jgi:hypothetical protein